MTTPTALKLPDELKQRIAPLARAAGKSAHAWMVEALEAQATLAEVRSGFIEDARRAAADIDRGAPLFAAEDVHAYILARAAGRVTRRPKPVKRARKGGGAR